MGDVINVETQPGDFGRIAAQTAKQVILQRIREAERDTVYENFAHRVGETLNAQVRSVDAVSGALTVLLDDRHECLIMRDEQIPGERLRRGDYIRVYVVDVHKSNRGPVIRLSRTHRNLLRRLMEQEIPEVRDGTVELKAIAREPGARSKVAVTATQPGVDAVGSCVGMRGLRIQNIVNELAGEKIDVVEWNPELMTLHLQCAQSGQGQQCDSGRQSHHQDGRRRRARSSAQSCHRQRGAKCPSCRQVDRLAYRYQERE